MHGTRCLAIRRRGRDVHRHLRHAPRDATRAVGPETRRLFWGAHLEPPAEATRVATLGASALADLTACAMLAPIVLPPELSYPLAPPWTEAMTELRQGVASHEAFRWVEDIYRRHRGAASETTSPRS